MGKIIELKDSKEFAKIILTQAIFPTKKENYLMELRGKVNHLKSGPFADHYKFEAEMWTGIIFNDIKNMKKFRNFYEIYPHFYEEKEEHDEKREILNRLSYIAETVQNIKNSSDLFIAKRSRDKTLETFLDEEKRILTIYPLQ
jgi:hypothetical protein